MAWSAIPYSSNALFQPVHQVGHGFGVGDVLTFNGTNFVQAQADTADHARVYGMVAVLNGANDFWMTMGGFVSGITTQSLTANKLYYLDDTNPGRLNLAAPTGVGEIVVPLFESYTVDSGFFTINPGVANTTPSIIPWETVTADTLMQINHNYWINSGAQLLMTMPGSMGTSDAIEIACPAGGGGFQIKFVNTMSGNQVCDFINQQTSAAGTITLDTTLGVKGGSIKINCHTTDVGMMVTTSTGNFIVA